MTFRVKRLHIRLAGFLSASLVVAGILTPTVLAQTNQGTQSGFNFSATPVVANLDTKPGVATTTQVQVKNNGPNVEHVTARLLKFKSDNVSGSPLLSEPEANDEFVGWVKFSETTFDAEPNVWKKIDVTVSPPASAAFGYYYAVAFSRSSQTPQTAGAVTNLNGTVAVPMLLNVETPGTVRKADMSKFSIGKNVYEFLPAKFTVTLKNNGNTHVAPRGNIAISKGGKNVATLEVNDTKGNILPNTSRQFEASWSDGSPVYEIKKGPNGQRLLDKKGQPISSLSWSHFDPSKLRFGRYHAKVVLVYSDGKRDVPISAEVDFWVIPWRIIGISAVILLLVLAGLWAIILRPLQNRIKKDPNTKNKTYKVDA